MRGKRSRVVDPAKIFGDCTNFYSTEGLFFQVPSSVKYLGLITEAKKIEVGVPTVLSRVSKPLSGNHKNVMTDLLVTPLFIFLFIFVARGYFPNMATDFVSIVLPHPFIHSFTYYQNMSTRSMYADVKSRL